MYQRKSFKNLKNPITIIHWLKIVNNFLNRDKNELTIFLDKRNISKMPKNATIPDPEVKQENGEALVDP